MTLKKIHSVPVLLTILTFFFISCGGAENSGLKFTEKGRDVPAFNADSAYAFIEAQVAYGPRIPGTDAHQQTADYLTNKLRSYAGRQNVFVQRFEQEGYDETLQLSNIIAAFNPSAADRILICAHWDTRAASDEDENNPVKPFAAADDGGSGVGVILELARIFSEHDLPVGVDVVLFDGEDYGRKGDIGNYFLGSRYWAQNPPVPGYSPRFGILLDMVGAKEARFPKEKYSLQYAPSLVEEIWSIAQDKGYEDLFPDETGAAVLDDHYIINQQARIPMVDIINHSDGQNRESIFPEHWHTQRDNMDIISTEILEAVGNTLTELLYNRI